MAALTDNEKALLKVLAKMRRTYGHLHDGLNDMIGEGEGSTRLTADMIPDDYQWLTDTLEQCVSADYEAKTLINRILNG